MAENELSLRASIICHGDLGVDSLCVEIWLYPFAESAGSAAEQGKGRCKITVQGQAVWFACGVLGFDVSRSSVVLRWREKVGHVRVWVTLYIQAASVYESG